jgi:iron complex transport system substrate-binding protein
MGKRHAAHLIATAIVILAAGCSRKVEKQTGGDRVVSLAPNMTEIVCAIGAADTLVGRTTACNYPRELVSKIPIIGDFGVPSFESVVAARPTLILEVDLQNATVGRKFDELGLKRLRVPCRNLSDIPIAIRSIGVVLHREGHANAIADSLSASIDDYSRAAPKHNRPKVFVEVWGEPLVTCGGTSFTSELIALAGGENIGDRIARQYFDVSPEWVISHNPDVILCLSKPSKGSLREMVMKRPGWQGINAVKNGRVYDKFNLDVISRPGPRVLQGIDELRDCIAGKQRTE